MILASRTKKARRTSTCPLCRCRMNVGTYIALLGKSWVHASCAAGRIRTLEGDDT